MAFKSNAVANVTTDTTVTPTVNVGQTFTIIGLSIANNGSTSINATVKLVKPGATAHIVKDAIILAGGALVVVGGDQKVVLEEGDSVTVTSSTSGQADVIVSYLV